MTEDAEGPTLADFSERVGEEFEVAVGGHRLALALVAAEALQGSQRPAGGFRLEFLGPLDPMLTQGIFAFAQGGDRWELFIVPLARSEVGTRYEAVFY